MHLGNGPRRLHLAAVLAGLVAAPLQGLEATAAKPPPPGRQTAAASSTQLLGFATPNANIHCTYLQKAENLVCSMRVAHYGTTMNEDCRSRTGFQWQGWQLYRRHRTIPICAPNTLWRGQPAYTTLAYGRTWKRGIFTCVSQHGALTCRTSTGHGLYVAFDSWRAW